MMKFNKTERESIKTDKKIIISRLNRGLVWKHHVGSLIKSRWNPNGPDAYYFLTLDYFTMKFRIEVFEETDFEV